MTIEDQIAEGDKVVTRYTIRGMHKGEYEGIAPTDKQVTFTGAFTYRIEGGKIVERWNNWDRAGLLEQIRFMVSSDTRPLNRAPLFCAAS